jgi:hypothetical protein
LEAEPAYIAAVGPLTDSVAVLAFPSPIALPEVGKTALRLSLLWHASICRAYFWLFQPSIG